MQKHDAHSELSTGNIWKLLLKFAIPSVIAMTASSLYHITDSIFIGQGVSAMAISGLAITFPIMNLSAAFGTLVGAGASTLMSLRLGQKDYDSANKILGNLIILTLIIGISFSALVLIFMNPILYFFGASENTIEYARDYMLIITMASVITHLYFGLNALLRAIGQPRLSMIATILSVIINALLAYIFIFNLNWGIKGAALATVMAQLIMLGWQVILFSKKEKFIRFKKGIFILDSKIVKDTLAIGMAPFMMNAAACIIVIILNQGLIKYGGDLHVGAYGIINRVGFLFVMIVMGLTQGMQPIAGYNFGAQRFDRVNKVLTYTIILGTIVTTIGFLISEFLPGPVARLFTSDQVLIDLVIKGMRIVFIFFPIVGFQMVISNFFQSIGHAKKAILMSLSRQVIVLLPSLLILPRFFGVDGIWYSMPVSDILASTLAAYLLIDQYKKSLSST